MKFVRKRDGKLELFDQERITNAIWKAAKAVGAHGIMVEIHPDPATALSDGPQALTFEGFAALMADLLA